MQYQTAGHWHIRREISASKQLPESNNLQEEALWAGEFFVLSWNNGIYEKDNAR